MNSQQLINELEKHIIRIFDENDNEIQFDIVSIKNEKRKFSSTTSLVFYINNIALTGKQMKTYKVEYICRCNRKHIILLHKYIHKPYIVCQNCLQDKTFSEYYIIPNSKNNEGSEHKSKNVLKNNTFDDESEIFKNNFFKSHLTHDEFYTFLPYIYKINSTIINDITKIQYKLFKVNNQIKYTFKISFDGGNTFETIKSVWQKCSICNKIYQIHIYNLINKQLDNIRCKTCSFYNHRYKIELYDDSGLTYQSKPEYVFIEQCKLNNIQITNGLKIKYVFNGKEHKYITDFYLPEYKYCIEIKGNNIWYKNDLKSGKQIAKENAAIEYCKKHNMKYNVIFSENINSFINNLLSERDSLGIRDNSREINSSQIL